MEKLERTSYLETSIADVHFRANLYITSLLYSKPSGIYKTTNSHGVAFPVKYKAGSLS